MTDKTLDWHQQADFKQHSHADWRDAVDKLLAGADFTNTLVSSTLDNIEIQPLYQQDVTAPFISRGTRPWSIQQTYHTGSLESTNRQILSDLSDGVNSIELEFATTGLDQTDNESGIACYNLEDLAQLLNGVHTEMVQISLTPGSKNRLTGALLLAYYRQQHTAPEQLQCAFNIDPLKSLALSGHCATSALSGLEQYASYCANQLPNATSLCIDSSVYHNAGCTEAQEIAYTLATTVEYLRSLQSLTADEAFSQMRYRIALDSDFFLNVAKLRAVRELLRQIKAHCNAKPAITIIEAVSGIRALTTLDSATNILRISTQTAAAMTGGANGFNCTPYNQLTAATDKAQRLARNTHHMLIEESGLLNVDDPARGSGYVEALTKSLCESAWHLFQTIESAGGMHKALESGLVAGQIKQSCKKRSDALAAGDATMIGVTTFADLEETPQAAGTIKSNAIKSTHSTDQKDSIASVVSLVDVLSEGGSTLEYQHHLQAKASSTPLDYYRDAELFEKFRLRSQNYQTSNSKLPEATLITIGEQKDYSARAGFCKNFLGVAGIKTQLVDLNTALHANESDRAQLMILCSSDNHYLDNAEKIASQEVFKNLWLAGNNPKVLSQLGSSISESIHLRANKTDLLEKALTLLGVPA